MEAYKSGVSALKETLAGHNLSQEAVEETMGEVQEVCVGNIRCPKNHAAFEMLHISYDVNCIATNMICVERIVLTLDLTLSIIPLT